MAGRTAGVSVSPVRFAGSSMALPGPDASSGACRPPLVSALRRSGTPSAYRATFGDTQVHDLTHPCWTYDQAWGPPCYRRARRTSGDQHWSPMRGGVSGVLDTLMSEASAVRSAAELIGELAEDGRGECRRWPVVWWEGKAYAFFPIVGGGDLTRNRPSAVDWRAVAMHKYAAADDVVHMGTSREG